jgi:bifunctional enzyme Fae/Hps
MYLIGEALIGDGNELAHIDLLMGDKNGPVGSAFANALTQLSAGHTPLLAVIRPNLLTKPATIIVPKVTLKNGEQVSQMFGPIQAAVSKGIADALEEGVFDSIDIENTVIIVSAYLDTKARDYNLIYRYNYGATKLSITRALAAFPDKKTIIYEKDRAAHAVMGFKVQRLWDPPYLQVACDIVDLKKLKSVLAALPRSDHIIIEAGTPLIKKFGLQVLSEIRSVVPDSFIVADMKVLDTGNLEARMAFDASADAVVFSGLAPIPTIEKGIEETRKTGIYSVIDMLNVEDPVGLIKALSIKPDVVELHRAIDAESTAYAWGNIADIKAAAGKKLLVATAGGIRAPVVPEALGAGADILVVGRAITASRDVRFAAEEFLERLQQYDIDQFRIMTDF